MAILFTILGISLLIILHEAGHYAVAKACGMRVLTFSVGFGPALLRTHWRGTTWQLSLIPLGGYVQIDGLGPNEDNEPPKGDTEATTAIADNPPPLVPSPSALAVDRDPHSYRNKPAWQRAAVILAGPAVNWLIAAVVIAALAATTGTSHYEDPIIGTLQSGAAAERAGLHTNDRVLRADNRPVADWWGFVAYVRAHPEQPIALQIQRGEHVLDMSVIPDRAPEGGHGIIGVTPAVTLKKYGPIDAIAVGCARAWELTYRYAALLWGLISGQQAGQLSGLPGIVKMVAAEAQQGVQRFGETLAWLSIGLFLLNLMPIPALDGGRLVFITIEAIRRRPVGEKVESVVHATGFALLLALMIFVSVRDLL